MNGYIIHPDGTEIQTCDRSVVRIRWRKKTISLHADSFLKKGCANELFLSIRNKKNLRFWRRKKKMEDWKIGGI